METAARPVVIPIGKDFRGNKIFLNHLALEELTADESKPCLTETYLATCQGNRMQASFSDLVTIPSRFASTYLESLTAIIAEEAECHSGIVLDKSVSIALWSDENHSNGPVP